jgi:hypothetical protein
MQRYCSQTEYGALYTSRGTVHGGLFMEYCSRVTIYGVLGGRTRQIYGAASAMQRSVVGFARLACSGSGGSFLRTGLLRCSDLRVEGRRCCDATGLGSGYPEISERQGGSGREGIDYWAGRWGLRS